MLPFHRLLASGVACGLMLAGSMFVEGQSARQDTRERSRTEVQSKQRTRTSSEVEVRRTSVLVGANVALHGNDVIGTVEDLVINDRGCIEFVVVTYEGKLLPVPYAVATVDFGDRVLMLDIDRDVLVDAPTFTKGEFTVFAQADFRQRIDTFYSKSERRERTETRSETRSDSRRREGRDDARRDEGREKRDSGRTGDRAKNNESERRSDKAAPSDDRNNRSKEQKDDRAKDSKKQDEKKDSEKTEKKDSEKKDAEKKPGEVKRPNDN